MDATVTKARVRRYRQSSDPGLFPDIQFGSTGGTISVVDTVTSSVVTAVILAAFAEIVGFGVF